MTENQVKSVAARVVGFTITALMKITVKHRTGRRVRRRRRREELGETGSGRANTSVIMRGASSHVRGLLLASTLEKENMNAIIIWALLQNKGDVTMNAIAADARRSARRSLIMITVRGKTTSSKATKKESMSAKFITALDQLQTQ